MAIPHKTYNLFVKSLGLNNIPEAINHFGSIKNFKKELEFFYLSSKKASKRSYTRHIEFAEGYVIFKNGKCYNKKTDSFLTKTIKTNHNNDMIYLYDLNPYGRFLISRLVFFCFSDHDYIDIKKMPIVIHIDNNPENNNLNNLKLKESSIVEDKRYIYNKSEGRGICKSEISQVRKMINEKKTYKDIAKVYKTSAMTVFRFVKKHIKNEQ